MRDLGIEATVEKISDMAEIIALGALMTLRGQSTVK